MKSCIKCEVEKPLSEYYKHKQMGDGHLNKCKECTKKDVRENRSQNLEYYRGYDRKRGSRQGKEYSYHYRERYPKKYKARTMLGNAVRDGRLEKSYECSSCGIDNCRIYGHHDDYDKPLDVRWLCQGCHRTWHAKNGEGLNAE